MIDIRNGIIISDEISQVRVLVPHGTENAIGYILDSKRTWINTC